MDNRIDDAGDEAMVRVPGLFRRWELQALLESGRDYRIEDAGVTADGTPLLAVWSARPLGPEGRP